MSSKTVGSGLASLGAFIFFYYSTWVFVTVISNQPFIHSEHWLNAYFLDRRWAVRIPQILLVVGVSLLLSLLVVTLLCSKKEKKA